MLAGWGLNRQILNNSVKRKAMGDLCERAHKLIHNELRSQYLDTDTYNDTKNISRNIHKARSSQLLPLPKYIEETLEALNTVQVLTSSTEPYLLMNWKKKTILMFSCKKNLKFSAPLMCFMLTGHSNEQRSFSTKYLQFIDSLRATGIFLTGQ